MKKIYFLLAFLVLVVVLEAFVIRDLYSRRIDHLPSYDFKFTDLSPFSPGDAILMVSGSWVSDTELAFPYQTTKIQCDKRLGYCFKSEADVDDGLLYNSVDYQKIKSWDENEVILEPEEHECVSYQTKIDLEKEEVTSVRRTIKTSGTCEGTQTNPIYLHLQDGQERLDAYK